MNNINIIGNLGRDPQLNASGTVASFSVAVRRQFKDKQTGEYISDWFNCKAFNKTAELIQNSFQKGSQIAFTGHLQNNNYEKDGQMIYRDEIIVDSITFIGKKTDISERLDGGHVNTQGYNSNANWNQNQSQNGFGSTQGYADNIQDDDLPF